MPDAQLPVRETFVTLLNLHIQFVSLQKAFFFVQLIKDRLQNSKSLNYSVYTVWCNLHFNNIGTIDYNNYHYTVCIYVQGTFLGISFTHISVNFYIRVIIKIWSIYKKEKKFTAQKKNMKSCKVSVFPCNSPRFLTSFLRWQNTLKT